MNAVYLEGERCGPQLFLGRGAGRLATTSAVVADLLRVAGNRREGIVDELPTLASEVGISPIEDLERPGYVRMNLKHVPGSIAEASRIMGDHGLNIEDSMQRRRFRVNVDGETFIPDIVTLEPLPFGVIGKALDALRGSNRVAGDPVYLRFEE
jgi:homoserine dehydrogenase